jgi:hypothetical protein
MVVLKSNSTTSKIPTKHQDGSSQVDNFTGGEHRATLLLNARRFGFDFDGTFFLEHSEARLLIQYVSTEQQRNTRRLSSSCLISAASSSSAVRSTTSVGAAAGCGLTSGGTIP